MFVEVGFLHRVVEPCIRKFFQFYQLFGWCVLKRIYLQQVGIRNTEYRIQNAEGRIQGGYLWRRINSMFADRNLAPFMFVSAATCRGVLGKQRRRWEDVEG